jgi:hypothetical protein
MQKQTAGVTIGFTGKLALYDSHDFHSEDKFIFYQLYNFQPLYQDKACQEISIPFCIPNWSYQTEPFDEIR